VSKYGSDLLQQALKAGYECNDGYLAERLACDYPGFIINDRKYPRVDTPDRRCFQACARYEYAHCSANGENYYITIDDYLGKYQLIKLIDAAVETTALACPIDSIDDKEDWIFEYGSNLLQQSFMAGYVCNDRYLQERVACDYPGFNINPEKYKKVDSPSETCFYACLGYEHAYCSSSTDRNYYITIDGFLGKYQLIKLIDVPTTERSDLNYPAIAVNSVGKIGRIKLTNSLNSIASDLATPLGSVQLLSICSITGTLMYVTIEYLPKIFQAIFRMI
jgi:hypothetical protein